MMRWEYLIRSWDGEEQDANQLRLDDLGAERWELVAVTVNPVTKVVTFYFKRPLEQTEDDVPF